MRNGNAYAVIVLMTASVMACCQSACAVASGGLEAMQAGLNHINQGDCEAAVLDFSEALGSSDLSTEDRVRGYFDRGVAADSCGDIRAAQDDYSAALRLRPDFAAALINRGNTYRLQKLFVEARQDYQGALALKDVPAAYAYYGLGAIAAEEGQYRLAADMFDRALASDKDYALAREARDAIDRAYLAGVPAASAMNEAAAQSRSRRIGQARALRPGVPALRLSLPSAALPAQGSGVPHVSRHARSLPPTGSSFSVSAAARAQRPSSATSGSETAGRAESAEGDPGSGGAVVQLGSYRSRTEAMEAWQRIVAHAGDLLSSRPPHISEADLGGRGLFFRLRVTADSQNAADHLCASLKTLGLACWVTRASR